MLELIIYTVIGLLIGLLGFYLAIVIASAIYRFIKEYKEHDSSPFSFKTLLRVLIGLRPKDIKLAITLARLRSKHIRQQNLEKIKSEWKHQKEKSKNE
jgi:ABC-type antimicrobial peptide transport system permease subunit